MREENLRRHARQARAMSVLRQQNTIQEPIDLDQGPSRMSEAHENIQRLQALEQNLQSLTQQKQQLQAQLFEIEGALREIANSPVTYKIIGGVMISTPKDDLAADLTGRKELLELRIQTIEKQEKQITDKSKKLREDVMKTKE